MEEIEIKMNKKTKNILMIIGVILLAFGPACITQSATEGMNWLLIVGTIAGLLGGSILVVVREETKVLPKIVVQKDNSEVPEDPEDSE